MTIRPCPDCGGKGRIWRSPNCRTMYEPWGDMRQGSTSTACGYRTVTLPEYYECPLCHGVGRVEVQPLEKDDER